MKIMIVDDHAGVRNLIRQLIAGDDGTIVCECGSGQEAVDITPRFQPDFVTMDVCMPGLNGFEATRALLIRHPTARVVIVTLLSNPDLNLSVARCGAVACVVKDNLEQLRAVLLAHGLVVRGRRDSTVGRS